jgi:hypothetical protein
LAIQTVLGYITTLMVKPIWSVEDMSTTQKVKEWLIAKRIGIRGGLLKVLALAGLS